jgi:hypothetical protein
MLLSALQHHRVNQIRQRFAWVFGGVRLLCADYPQRHVNALVTPAARAVKLLFPIGLFR